MKPSQLKKHDWPITLIVIVLLLISALIIYSTTIASNNAFQGENALIKQLIFIIVGIVVYFVLSITEFSWFSAKRLLGLFYVIILGFLIYVKFFGKTISGANRWLSFGFFSFQPSEYSKIIIILITAAMFSIQEKVSSKDDFLQFGKNKKQQKKIKHALPVQGLLERIQINHPSSHSYFKNILIVAPIIILVFIQPALGSAIIIFVLWAILLYISLPNQTISTVLLTIYILFQIIILRVSNFSSSGGNFIINLSFDINLLIPSLVVIAIAIILVYKFKIRFVAIPIVFSSALILTFSVVYSWNNILGDYQKTRIETFIQGPESDPLGAGYQVRQSKIAIGSGMLFGRGFLQGTQSNLNVLTQAHTDFIYASISEQFGFVGGILVLVLFLILILRILRIGQETVSIYGSFICIGVAVLLSLHIFINIGMNLGKLPVTGIPLPLVSYGGSSIFLNLISLGIIQSIGASRKSVDIADNLMLTSQSLTI